MWHWSRLRNRLLAFVAMVSATGPIVPSAYPQELGEEDVWRRTQTLGTVEAYEAYLRQFPLGKYTREAYRRAVVLAVREQSPEFEIINPPGWEVGPIAREPTLMQEVAPAAPPVDAAAGTSVRAY